MVKKKAPSKHSRAARRATAVDIDTDKSLKEITPPTLHRKARPSVLSAHAGSGVSKKASRRKSQPSSRARRRHEKALEMAEAVVERTGKKVQRSKSRGRSVQERARGWDDINRAAVALGEGPMPGDEDEEDEGGNGPGKEEWEETDEEMDEKTDNASAAAVVVEETKSGDYIPVDDDGDDIL
ncbi:hypothetical protein N3K66_007102 [Trichothecium roseum]|uniref:Uncharacterized protein n=1 Tax=Trichothecium roseum TaxID=47278 RepID=A0ACC0UYI4_9HYPO|nr:hypothetical protein N3K66_007102 [Trichothecium roseum]